jgi:hypothetical protein
MNNSGVADDLNVTLGAVELGTMLSSVLYGIILIQAYKYYQASFKNDGYLLKWMVWAYVATERPSLILSNFVNYLGRFAVVHPSFLAYVKWNFY